ncbi:MAG: hypothetical protein HC888_12230 [Candidatus Competibacteraceae bacterium]|nr:hypothetical protein [Candidatus Competibacteraceae bacterium]
MTKMQISKTYAGIESTCSTILSVLTKPGRQPNLQTVLALNSIMLDARLAKDTPKSHRISLTRIEQALTDIPTTELLRPSIAVAVLVLSRQK